MYSSLSSAPPRKILIIRLSSIGDVVLTTPVIRLLKQNFPNCEIDFVVKSQFANILTAHPFINRILIFDKNDAAYSLKNIRKQIIAQKYDLIVDLHKNIRSVYLTIGTGAATVVRYKKDALRRFLFVKFRIQPKRKFLPVYQRYLACLSFLGIQDDFAGPDFFVDQSIRSAIAKKYAKYLGEYSSLIIGVAPGASFKTKRWIPEGFAEVIDRLINEQNAGIILFGNKEDRNITRSLRIKNRTGALDVAGELSIEETAALMSHCHTVITNDTGLMHIATALGKKVVAIFGSTTEELGFFPYNTEFSVMQNNSLNCRPCSHIGRQKCPKKHFKCMKEISPKRVYDTVVNMLDR